MDSNGAERGDAAAACLDRALAGCARWGRGARPYMALGAALLAFHLLVDATRGGYLADHIRLFLIAGVASVAALAIALALAGRLTPGRAAALAIAAGFLIRLAYVLYTGVYDRQHDVGWEDQDGHMGYIMKFARGWALPGTYDGQYYHPPLHHFLAAMWVRASVALRMEWGRALEGVQYLTAFYSSALMVVCHRLFRRVGLAGWFRFAATAIVALHPTLFILAGSVNNDMLATLLYASALLWLMKWREDPGLKNTVFLALCTGLCVMTKTNGATLALIIAPFFLAKLLERRPWEERAGVFGRVMLFADVALPLGLWHPITRLAAVGQPLGFVPQPGGGQYTGDHTLVERVFSFPLKELFAARYCRIGPDYNLPVYIVKCSMFGEFSFGEPMDGFAVALLAANVAAILLSLAAMAYALARRKPSTAARPAGAGGDGAGAPARPAAMLAGGGAGRIAGRFAAALAGPCAGRWMLFATWLVQVSTLVAFYVKYPHTCTMDFRYIVPTLACGAGFIGLACQDAATLRPRLWRGLRWAVAAVLAALCLFSAAFYLFN